MIMGSANVNDRSMVGDRDSEVALRIEDTIHVASRMVNHRDTPISSC
jgi:phosphatidylserine/phosphatidylglycerophosphate/cardiolipin synthase-like enzyme